MELNELLWLAGFLEGEGSFTCSRNQLRVCAPQVNQEPLNRIQQLIGGQIRCNRRPFGWSDIYRWSITASTPARQIMCELYPWMSLQRKQQIVGAIWKWRPRRSGIDHSLPSDMVIPDSFFLDPLRRLAWAAGFLEAEGTFLFGKASGSPYIQAAQVQVEPLMQLVRFFGGSVSKGHAASGKRRASSRWTITGRKAIGLMFSLYPFLSTKRRSEADTAIQTWKARWIAPSVRTHCIHGHELSGRNVATRVNGNRRCRVCVNAWARKYRLARIGVQSSDRINGSTSV